MGFPTESNPDSTSGIKIPKQEEQLIRNKHEERERVSEFAERTSCHGPKMIAISENIWRKFFWLTAFSVVICVLIAQVATQTDSYSDEATFQDVRKSYVANVSFPSFTICNFNRFKRTSLQEMSIRYNISQDSLWLYLAMLLYNTMDIQFDQKALDANIPELSKVYKTIERIDGNVNAMELLEEATLKPKDFFVKDLRDPWTSCGWFGHKPRHCDHSMFHSIFTSAGRCLVFNAPFDISNEFIQIMEGYHNGFTAMLDVQLKESSEIVTDLIRGNIDVGFSVAVHPRGSLPRLHRRNAVVGPGNHLLVSLSLKRVHHLNLNTKPCFEHDMIDGGWKYTIVTCLTKCIADNTYSLCGCEPLNTHPFAKRRYCTTVTDFKCIWSGSQAETLYRMIVKCHQNCKCPCKEEIYQAQEGIVSFPSPSRARAITVKEGPSVSYMRENASVMSIFLDTFVNEFVTKKRKITVSDIITAFGSAMGLMLGASVLTVLEFLDYAICTIISKIKITLAASNS